MEKKVLQEVIYLLKINGGILNKLKLMKELYLADRLSISETCYSISGDEYFSMKNGPVLSQTLNLLDDCKEWTDYIDRVGTDYYDDIKLKKEIEFDYLSEMDKHYLKTIADECKDKDTWDIRNFTHTLPEWKDTKREKIKFVDILMALNFTDDEIKEIKEEQEIFEMS